MKKRNYKSKMKAYWAWVVLFLSLCIAPVRAYAAFNSMSEFDKVEVSDSVVTVYNVGDLMASVKDNATIILMPGTYNLSEWLRGDDVQSQDSYTSKKKGAFRIWEGAALCNVKNLTLLSADATEPAEIVSESAACSVLSLANCTNIRLQGLRMGHILEQGTCSGSVIYVESGKDIFIDDCDLYGCGAYGISTYRSNNIHVSGGRIHDCSYGCIEINETKDVEFLHTQFHDCREYTMLDLWGGSSALFIGCSFRRLEGNMASVNQYYENNDYKMYFVNCAFDHSALYSLVENPNMGDSIRILD